MYKLEPKINQILSQKSPEVNHLLLQARKSKKI